MFAIKEYHKALLFVVSLLTCIVITLYTAVSIPVAQKNRDGSRVATEYKSLTRFALIGLTMTIAFVGQLAPASATTRTFYSPSLYGDRLSACLGEGSVCGKLVADRLCATHGFSQALIFRLDRMTEPGSRLRTIDNEITGLNNSVPTFIFVKCYSPSKLAVSVSN
jgi:hypothetical protein